MQVVYLIDDGIKLREDLNNRFAEDKIFRFKTVKRENLEVALKDLPGAIIINEETIDDSVENICKQIRKNEDNAITPIIVLSSSHELQHSLSVLESEATFYLITPVDIDYLYYVIKNIMNLLFYNRKVSPLTSLPGNVQIQSEIKKRLSRNEFFVMLYFDLDNFKAYNDYYGFSKGDEIIKFTARTILDHVNKDENDTNFVGHIGGDDFVAIISNKRYEKICQEIIKDFDEGVRKYFDKADIIKGYLEVTNRKGIIEEFPITTISIGVVEVDEGRFSNPLEIGEAAAGVKHLAKTIAGSTYVIDRRKKEG
jgi:diguanylate cyclase (GGDEF)-like protein